MHLILSLCYIIKVIVIVWLLFLSHLIVIYQFYDRKKVFLCYFFLWNLPWEQQVQNSCIWLNRGRTVCWQDQSNALLEDFLWAEETIKVTVNGEIYCHHMIWVLEKLIQLLENKILKILRNYHVFRSWHLPRPFSWPLIWSPCPQISGWFFQPDLVGRHRAWSW